jgi:hypothetical protein
VVTSGVLSEVADIGGWPKCRGFDLYADEGTGEHAASYHYSLLSITKQNAPAIKSRSHVINTSNKTTPKGKPDRQHNTG